MDNWEMCQSCQNKLRQLILEQFEDLGDELMHGKSWKKKILCHKSNSLSDQKQFYTGCVWLGFVLMIEYAQNS